jgi:hypothetical protein
MNGNDGTHLHRNLFSGVFYEVNEWFKVKYFVQKIQLRIKSFALINITNLPSDQPNHQNKKETDVARWFALIAVHTFKRLLSCLPHHLNWNQFQSEPDLKRNHGQIIQIA